MNEYTVIGIRKFSYTSKRTGETVEAVNVYVTYEDKKTDGVACEALFVKRDVFDDCAIVLGDKVLVNYNRFGNVIGFTVK